MNYKPYDKVKTTRSWPAAQVGVVGGSWATFDLSTGMQGVILADATNWNAPDCWVVEFEGHPGEYVIIAEQWLDLVQSAPLKAITIEPIKKISCDCPTLELMSKGCTCGHIVRYVEPHKRLLI